MPRIYVSHRSEDSSHDDIPIILDLLRDKFGHDNVFDTTDPTSNTTAKRQILVKSCDVLLIIVGRFWTAMVDELGNNMLFDPYDPVNIEISTGLATEMAITTVVVDGVDMPATNQLPDYLHGIYDNRIRRARDETIEVIMSRLMKAWAKIESGTMARQHHINLNTMLQIASHTGSEQNTIYIDDHNTLTYLKRYVSAWLRYLFSGWSVNRSHVRLKNAIRFLTQHLAKDGNWFIALIVFGIPILVIISLYEPIAFLLIPVGFIGLLIYSLIRSIANDIAKSNSGIGQSVRRLNNYVGRHARKPFRLIIGIVILIIMVVSILTLLDPLLNCL